ncbi:hypothetical protein M569_17021, partial [Genlisea aurea]
MVNYLLMITAELENLQYLQPQGGCDDPNFNYYFKLKCGNCGEVTQKETCVCLSETVASTRGKGEVHLNQKCKFCSREGTLLMIKGKGQPLTQEHAETGKFAPLMLFDCRGFEPLDFLFAGGWEAESIDGTKFVDIDLSGGDYFDYDENGQCPVMISNPRARFTV